MVFFLIHWPCVSVMKEQKPFWNPEHETPQDLRSLSCATMNGTQKDIKEGGLSNPFLCCGALRLLKQVSGSGTRSEFTWDAAWASPCKCRHSVSTSMFAYMGHPRHLIILLCFPHASFLSSSLPLSISLWKCTNSSSLGSLMRLRDV